MSARTFRGMSLDDRWDLESWGWTLLYVLLSFYSDRDVQGRCLQLALRFCFQTEKAPRQVTVYSLLASRLYSAVLNGLHKCSRPVVLRPDPKFSHMNAGIVSREMAVVVVARVCMWRVFFLPSSLWKHSVLLKL